MIRIQEYPKNHEIAVIVYYFFEYPFSRLSEGIFLVIGKDNQGKEYKPRHEVTGYSYALPSGKYCDVPGGRKKYPAIYFPFKLSHQLKQPEIFNAEIFDDKFWSKIKMTFINETVQKVAPIKPPENFGDEFLSKLDLILMDETTQKIFLIEPVEKIFKEIAARGIWKSANLSQCYFWEEVYRKRTSALEEFLEEFREGKKCKCSICELANTTKCTMCKSTNVVCSHEYFTTGGDMEYVRWRHECQNCGHIISKIIQSCYGYDNYHNCPFPNCKNTYQP